MLLLDEPTAGLDPATENQLISDLSEATRGKTVILVAHAPALVASAGQVLRLDAGRARTVAGSR